MPRGIARDHETKRAALRKGAARYFARHGFDRASMTGAARECGVSKALLYHYYDGKEALLFDILDAHLSRLLTMVKRTDQTDLQALIAAILATYENADAEHKLQLDALASLPRPLQEPLIARQRELVAIMATAVARVRPDLAADPLRAATMTVFGILNWVYMWHKPGKGLDRGAYAELAARFVKGGLDAI